MICKSEVLAMTAVIYARYSSDNQREESIGGQTVSYTHLTLPTNSLV